MDNKKIMMLILAIGSLALIANNYKQIKSGIITMLNKISPNGLNFLILNETGGKTPSLIPFKDANGWSIGFGHYMGKTPTMQKITLEKARELLMQDIAAVEKVIHNNVTVPITQNMHDALVSFGYNIGLAGLKNSDVIRQLNKGNIQLAAKAFHNWDNSQGKPILKSRREKELQLFLS